MLIVHSSCLLKKPDLKGLVFLKGKRWYNCFSHMKKNHTLIIYSFFVFSAVFALGISNSSDSYALAPTEDTSRISPLIHGGAGAQSILGPLLIGSSELISTGGFSGLQAVSTGGKRPSIFSSVKASSLFTVLTESFFAGRVFIGFAKNDFPKAEVDTVPLWNAAALNPQRINVQGNILSTGLDSSHQSTTNTICVHASGTLVLCP